eukprot:2338009-Pleurochrysis_carterae.AAC.3
MFSAGFRSSQHFRFKLHVARVDEFELAKVDRKRHGEEKQRGVPPATSIGTRSCSIASHFNQQPPRPTRGISKVRTATTEPTGGSYASLLPNPSATSRLPQCS